MPGKRRDHPKRAELHDEGEDLVGERVDADVGVGLEGGEDEHIDPGDAVGTDADDPHRSDSPHHGRDEMIGEVATVAPEQALPRADRGVNHYAGADRGDREKRLGPQHREGREAAHRERQDQRGAALAGLDQRDARHPALGLQYRIDPLQSHQGHRVADHRGEGGRGARVDQEGDRQRDRESPRRRHCSHVGGGPEGRANAAAVRAEHGHGEERP